MSTMIQNPTPEFDPEAPVKFSLEQEASRSALELVVVSFNPSQNDAVGRIKLLSAALITECEKLRVRPKLPPTTEGGDVIVPNKHYNDGLERGARWASIAISKYEEAAMFAVKSLTAIKYR